MIFSRRKSKMTGDLDMKLEEMDPDIESFFRNDGEVNLNETISGTQLLVPVNELQPAVQKQTNNTVAIVNQMNTKNWLDEILDYSSNIARQTQSTLDRIKKDFVRNGLKFDADFRSHFLYIANNR